MRSGEIMMLDKTLERCNSAGNKVSLEDMREAIVYLPDEVHEIVGENAGEKKLNRIIGPYTVNADSLTLAREMRKQFPDEDVLVLNFANPVNPGGGVRNGAIAQEEDICRKSSLLVSLEGKKAAKYYSYNKTQKTYLGTDAVIISPKVEIFRDKEGEFLDESETIAVLTCAAPMIKRGLEGKTEEEYVKMLYIRIDGMLAVAEKQGYKHLVLGAWGCGAFGNDAKTIAPLFREALKEHCFDNVAFGVPKGHYSYNFDVFNKVFDGTSL